MAFLCRQASNEITSFFTIFNYLFDIFILSEVTPAQENSGGKKERIWSGSDVRFSLQFIVFVFVFLFWSSVSMV